MRQWTAALAAMLAAVLASCAGHFTYPYRDVRVGCLDPLISPDGRWILFVFHDAAGADVVAGRREGNEEVMICRADGSGLRNLSNHPGPDRMATWSADGLSVYFCSRRDGNWRIYRIGTDGSDLRRLTNGPASDILPRPSPDGTRLLFTRGADLMVAAADGSDATKLDRGYGGIWSPDGLWVAYVQEDLLRVVKADGTEQGMLPDGWPLCWTPDSRSLLFAKWGFGIRRVDRTGTNYRHVLDVRAIEPREARFAWSRDRMALAVNSMRWGTDRESGGVVIMNAEGKVLVDRRESGPPGRYDESVSWTPDGERIIFARHGSSHWGGILTMKADGTDLKFVLRDDLSASPPPAK